MTALNVRILSASLLVAAAAIGCVSPHLDGLATAECASADDCTGDQVCLSGQCGDAPPDSDPPDRPLPPDEGVPPDEGPPPDGALPPDEGVPPDVGPDAEVDAELDMAPDVEVDAEPDGDLDMAPDVELDMETDVEVDAEPDAEVDLAVDACAPQEEVCDGVDNDCDEAIDEEAALACPPLDGVEAANCIEALCGIAGCLPGRVDVDGVIENGCECVAFDGFERRGIGEPAGIDADCDGAPGDDETVVFVSAAAEPGGDGSPGNPFQTIGEGLEATLGNPQGFLVLDAGVYPMPRRYDLQEGRSQFIYGGFVYDPRAEIPWRRDAEARASIEVAGDALPAAFNVDNGGQLLLHRLTITAGNNGEPVGIRGIDCEGILLQETDLIVGLDRATNGSNGRAGGVFASAPDDGLQGQPGGTPGAGGRNPECPEGTAGGGGGRGDSGPDGVQATAGAPGGVDGLIGGQGGAGAGVDGPASDGEPGPDGEAGAHGVPASAAGRWIQNQGKWLPARGVAPTDGAAGRGGGGGGGGYFFESPEIPGPGGGGGGAAGCGGGAGTNGLGGFGSFGIVAQFCQVQLEGSTIVVAPGGRGGDGGAGAAGNPGSEGGPPGPGGDQPAGAGGPGGTGACGGDGAGGPGGPSVGILLVDAATPMAIVDGVPAIDAVLDDVIITGDPAPGGAGAEAAARQCVRENGDVAGAGEPGVRAGVACCLPDESNDCGTLDCVF